MDALQFYIGASFAILDPTLQWESCTVLSNQGLVNDFLDFSQSFFKSRSLNVSGKFSHTIAGPLYENPNFRLSSNKKAFILDVIFTFINVSGYLVFILIYFSTPSSAKIKW